MQQEIKDEGTKLQEKSIDVKIKKGRVNVSHFNKDLSLYCMSSMWKCSHKK